MRGFKVMELKESAELLSRGAVEPSGRSVLDERVCGGDEVWEGCPARTGSPRPHLPFHPPKSSFKKKYT